MSQDVQWQEMEIPVLGMNERTDPVVMPPGQWVIAANAEFTTVSGSVRKRPGTDKICTTNFTKNRLAIHRDQLLAVDTDGDSVTPPRLYAPLEALGSMRALETVSPYTVEKTPISSEFGDNVISDLAIANGFVVYGICLLFSSKVIIRVKEISTGSIVAEQIVFKNSLDHPSWIRVSASKTEVLVSFSVPGTGSAFSIIYGVVVNCGGTSPAIGAVTTIVANEDATNVVTGSYHDTTGTTQGSDPRWFIIYRSAVGGYPGIILELKTASLTHGWTSTIGALPSAFSVFEHHSYVYVNYYNKSSFTYYAVGQQSWQYAAFLSSTGAVTTGPNDWCTDADLTFTNDIASGGTIFHPGRKSGITGSNTDTTGIVLWHSQPRHLSGNDRFDKRPMLRWRTTTIANSQGTLHQKRGAHLWCKPWADTENNTYYAWIGTTGRISEANKTDGASEWTLALLRINTDGLCLLDSSTAGQVLGYRFFANSSGFDSCPFSTALDANGAFHTTVNFRYARGEEIAGPQEIIARHDHIGRYSSVEFGGSTYFTGGVVTAYDGVRHTELAFINPPLFNAVIDSSTGDGLWHTGSAPEWVGAVVNYQVVYTLISPNGETLFSEPSDLIPVTITAANDTVVLTLEPATITRRYWSTSATLPNNSNVVISIYRSAIPNSSTLQRMFTYDNPIYTQLVSDSNALDPLYFTDRGSDANGAGDMYVGRIVAGTNYHYTDFSGNEPIYTNSGELENDLPYGGATCMTVHKDRLWIGGGDDPEVIWYSKERAADRPAEFSIQQQLRIAGERVTALESAGDYLIVFCESGVFIISGDGPNITADPTSGTFGVPFQISPIGCTQPRSTVYVPMGIIYRSIRGIHMVNWERTVVWIGQPVQNTVDAYPDVLAAEVVSDKTQVRFIVTNIAENIERGSVVSRVLVYDWEEDRWAVWIYSGFAPVDMVDWGDHGVTMLSADGNLYVENRSGFVDDGHSYAMLLETGWISFGRLQGFKRIRKFGLLLEQLGAHGITIRMFFNYRDDAGAPLNAIKSFTPTEIANISAPEWLRITAPYQKQPSIKLNIEETPDADNLDSAGFVLKSIAFEVGMVPGLNRLPARQSK